MRPDDSTRPGRVAPLLGVAFFASGASALIYQVCWQRLLALTSGVGTFSIALIVSAFMAGLGIGSLIGGIGSRRLSPRASLVAFAAVEALIGIFGALSPRIYHGWLYSRHAALYGQTWSAGLLHFASLLPPTLLMGMSLPLLTRAAVHAAATAPRVVAVLYGINVLGAAFGSLLAPWWLIRHHGIAAATYVAAAGNVAAAILATVAARRATTVPPSATEAVAGEAPHPDRRFALWLALYALSGFVALSLEMIWFRVLDIGVRATAFTFGTLLAFYLLGNGAGSLAGGWSLARPASPLRRFIHLQCLLLALSAASLCALVWVSADAPVYRWYTELWRGERSYNLGGAWNTASIVRLYVVLPLLLFGVPTVLMGLSFSALQRAVHDEARTSGLKVGQLQAANIVGCVAGTLLTGVGFLSWLGTMGTMRVLLALGAVFALVGLARGLSRRVAIAWVASLTALAAALPGQTRFWLRLHGTDDPEALVLEDATSVVALTPRHEGRWDFWVAGKLFSELPYGGIHTLLGAIPVAVHPAPRTIALIGLGSGDTAWAAGCRGSETKRVSVYEIAAPQERMLRLFVRTRNAPPELRRFLDDPRLRIVVADGRNALQHSEDRYDVIEMDPLRPTNAYSGNLYSREFFQACARRLNPGGILCSWSPSPRVQATLSSVFPHVLSFAGGSVLLGSQDPFTGRPEEWRNRLDGSNVRQYLGPGRWQAVVRSLDTAAVPAREAVDPRRVLSDLFPRDEFNTPETE